MDYSKITQLFEEREIAFLVQKYQRDTRDSHVFYRLIEAYRKQGSLDKVKHLLKNKQRRLGAHHRSLLSLFEGGHFFSTGSDFLPVPFRVFNKPFSDCFKDELWALVNKFKDEFNDARVYSNDTSRVDKAVRSSLAIYDKQFGEFKLRIHAELQPYLKQYTKWLNTFQINSLSDDLELEINVYTEGRGFKKHKDKGSRGAGSTRDLTFVYYFFKEPQQFKGGDLLLFDSNREGEECNGDFSRLKVKNDLLVIFPSDCYHQVTEIHSPKKNSLMGGRFTLNGWLHKNS